MTGTSAPSNLRHRAIAIGAVVGFGLWMASPLLGRREPWDTEWPIYTATMIAGGAVAGWWAPGCIQWFYLGLWLGQVAAVALLSGSDLSWFPIALVSTAVGSAIGLLGYVPAWLLRRFLKKPQS